MELLKSKFAPDRSLRKVPRFTREIEVSAPKERVWEVVSDVDREPEYWYGTKEVRNFSKEGNVINREITQNFLNTKILQRVALHPQEYVEVEYLQGTTVGTKVIRVLPSRDGRQLVRVEWEVRFNGILRLASPLIGRHVDSGTKNALLRIKQRAEEGGAVPGSP